MAGSVYHTVGNMMDMATATKLFQLRIEFLTRKNKKLSKEAENSLKWPMFSAQKQFPSNIYVL